MSFLPRRWSGYRTLILGDLSCSPLPFSVLCLLMSFCLQSFLQVSVICAQSSRAVGHTRQTAMPLITIPFPKLTLAPRSGGIELSLETSVSLDRQETLQSLCTYSDLVTAVQDDQLWVARRGISLLVVDFTNDGSSISELERVMVTDWIERHEVCFLHASIGVPRS